MRTTSSRLHDCDEKNGSLAVDSDANVTTGEVCLNILASSGEYCTCRRNVSHANSNWLDQSLHHQCDYRCLDLFFSANFVISLPNARVCFRVNVNVCVGLNRLKIFVFKSCFRRPTTSFLGLHLWVDGVDLSCNSVCLFDFRHRISRLQLEIGLRSLLMDGWTSDAGEHPKRAHLGLEDVHSHEADPAERFAGTARAVDLQLHGLQRVECRTAGLRHQQRGVCQHLAAEKLHVERRTVR